MKKSLASAVSGLAAGAFTLTVSFAPSEVGWRIGDWISYFVITFIYGAFPVIAVWLCVLWPLYVRLPRNSVLWHPLPCISIGAAAGATLYILFLTYVLRFPRDAVLAVGHLLAGIVVGAVTCAVGCYLKHNEQPHQIV